LKVPDRQLVGKARFPLVFAAFLKILPDNPGIATKINSRNGLRRGQFGARLLQTFEFFVSGLWIDAPESHAIP
jgi:hypothetical protein